MPSVEGAARSGAGRPAWTARVAAVWPWPLLAVLLGLLLGRAPVLGHAGPFGLAWVAALRVTGAPTGVLSALAAALGMAAQGGGLRSLPALRAVVSVVIVWVVARGRRETERGAPAVPPAAGTATAALAAGVAAAVGTGVLSSAGLDWIRTALEAGTAAVLAAVMVRGLTVRPSGARPAPGAAGSLLTVVLLLGVVAGLQDLQAVVAGIPPVPLASVAGSLAVLVASASAGPLAGAASGLLVGLAGLLAGPPGLPGLLRFSAEGTAFGTAGLLGGVFRDLGRTGSALGYLLAYVFLRALRQDAPPSYVWGEAAAALVAAAGLLVLPRGWLVQASGGVVAGALAAATEPAGRTSGGHAGAALLRERIGAVARLLRDVHLALTAGHRPPAQAPAVPDAIAPLVGQVVERVCHQCNLYRHCWENEFYRTYQVFHDLWERVEESGPLPTRLPPEELQRFCAYPGEVIASLNAVHDLVTAEGEARERAAEGRSVLALQVQALAGMLEHLAGALETAPDTAPPRYRVRTGVARMAKRGSLVSGDTHRALPLRGNRFLLALSDGMGAGRGAAAGSQEAMDTLVGLLEAGYPVQAAVQLVNAALVLKEPEGEHFATLDIALIDLSSGRADFVKVGAPPSILWRGRDVQWVRAEVPPAGIVYPLPLEAELRALRPGDWLILATDGLWAREGEAAGDRWLRALLATQGPSGPEELAQALLARALAGDRDGPADDITVLVAHLEPLGAADPGRTGEAPPATLPAAAARADPAERGPVPARRAPRGR
ncbi:SpoIIE family protein phosphatase [Caldinitratiruptor microaerophilus]|uniref:PPM-type phosphatase domain-containing protein n=1 Tax=Caldinitratiruptor microaerophilus TaxID=671077 RepID=A0AA35G6Y6_9FIRM|nr:SpoIIE family protein phosphatase [Caldinitratiruptor microaerophilus]BDG62041.1 hypothetical protein caldi_31310 [Caldinitratiruptor microaerophilus]